MQFSAEAFFPGSGRAQTARLFVGGTTTLGTERVNKHHERVSNSILSGGFVRAVANAADGHLPSTVMHLRCLKTRPLAFILAALLSACIALSGCHPAALLRVHFAPSASNVEVYDFVEVTAEVSWPRARNPFTDAEFRGWFESADGKRRWQVEGFCDSDDGSIFRIRFMPPAVGDYRYSVEYRQAGGKKTFTGNFHATDARRRGPIRIDSQHRWHFVWEGTGEHYFFNGTTAYWLMGWSDDKVIESSIERLHNLEVNIHVLDSDFGRRMENTFKDDIALSREITLERWQERLWQEKSLEWLFYQFRYWL